MERTHLAGLNAGDDIKIIERSSHALRPSEQAKVLQNSLAEKKRAVRPIGRVCPGDGALIVQCVLSGVPPSVGTGVIVACPMAAPAIISQQSVNTVPSDLFMRDVFICES